MNLGDFRKWLAFGTGIGIEIGAEDLNITVASVRPGGIRLLGELTIPQFREQPATEWGAKYSNFLKKLNARHHAATVLLPRDEVIVRQVSLPGVSDRDLASAIRFELDSLHPYHDGDALFDWARVGKTSAVLVGIARRDRVDYYSTLFAEAGVKVAAFTFSAAVIYSALRLYSQPPSGFLAITKQSEAYGESEAKPLFSAQLTGPVERGQALAIAELRLDADSVSLPLENALPSPKAAPPELDLSRTALPYATALAGAVSWPALSLNLLPEEQRQSTSRLRYIPTALLALVVLVLGAAAVAYPRYADRQYLALLQTQIRQIEPRARQAQALDRQIATTRNRSQVLDNFRRRTRDDMDALRELTLLLKPPAWLNALRLTRDQVTMSGEIEQAAPLLKLLDGSKNFKNSDFTVPMSRSQNGEIFSLRSARRVGGQ